MAQFESIDAAIDFLLNNLTPTNTTPGYPDAAGYLGNSGDVRALAPLLQALEEGNQYIRATAAIGLGKLGRREAIPRLLRAFRDDPGLYVRCDAALALGMLRADEALPLFVERFSTAEYNVQMRIVRALRRSGTLAALATLDVLRKQIQKSDLSQDAARVLLLIADA